MLRLEDLHVQVGDRLVLGGVNLHIRYGETHALFGPNGSGKTTLLGAIMGFARHRVVQGRIIFHGEDVTGLTLSERARRGMGIAFQRPPVLRGVALAELLAMIAGEETARIEALAESMNLKPLLERDVNSGFSGGELKRAELLQLLAQRPDLVLLDEPESGVDLENIVLVGRAINQLLEKGSALTAAENRRERIQGRKKAGLIITHTGHILDYVEADVGHVLYGGKLSCSGINPREMLGCIRDRGYIECTRCLG